MVIFRDNADRQVLLVLLKGVRDAYDWDLRAYCLMRNHFHPVLITATANFSDGMQRLLSTYVRYFNHRHNRGGHLLKRPFKSEPIKDERSSRSRSRMSEKTSSAQASARMPGSTGGAVTARVTMRSGRVRLRGSTSSAGAGRPV